MTLDKLQTKIVTNRTQELSFYIATNQSEKTTDVLKKMKKEELLSSISSIDKILKNRQRCYRIMLHSTYGAFTDQSKNLYDLLFEKKQLIEEELSFRQRSNS